jgi:hypothetical protein
MCKTTKMPLHFNLKKKMPIIMFNVGQKYPLRGNPMLSSIFDTGYAERAMAGRRYFINASEHGNVGILC